MQLVFQTRFAFMGKLSWRSQTSENPKLAFDPDRLSRRFDLMKTFMLPSIADQTDDDFKLVILTSTQLPASAKDYLRELCDTFVGMDRVTLMEEGPAISWNLIRREIVDQYGPDTDLVQISLDDDDAVAVDFVELMRAEAKRQHQADHFDPGGSFVNFSTGLRMDFMRGHVADVQMEHRPLHAPGCALIGPASSQLSPLLQQRGVEFLPNMASITTSRPMYLKTIHDYNDRARTEDTPPNTGPDLSDDVDIYFPMLMGKMPESA